MEPDPVADLAGSGIRIEDDLVHARLGCLAAAGDVFLLPGPLLLADDRVERHPSGSVARKAKDAGRDARKCNFGQLTFRRQPQRFAITRTIFVTEME